MVLWVEWVVLLLLLWIPDSLQAVRVLCWDNLGISPRSAVSDKIDSMSMYQKAECTIGACITGAPIDRTAENVAHEHTKYALEVPQKAK